MRQKQHVSDHLRHPLVLLHVRIENLAVLVDRPGTRQCDLRLRHEIGDRRAQLVRDIGVEV